MSSHIGIDTGARTGMAVVKDGKLLICLTCEHKRAVTQLHALLFAYSPAVVGVEMPGAGIYPRPGQSARTMLKIARNVGQCQARADELVRAARQFARKVIPIPPKRGATKKAIPAHVWRAMFPEWQGKTPSNHARDAAMIARNLSIAEGAK